MKKVLTLLAATFLSVALAHTAVTVVTPVDRAAVTAPKTVVLKFSGPVELRFSTFRVMAVPAGSTPQAAAEAALAERPESGKLAGLPFTGRTLAAQLSLPLKPHLPAGWYVVTWRVLSEDGHPVTGLSTFRVK